MSSESQQLVAGQITPQMSFNQKVWALTARIPKGQVLTYADVELPDGTRVQQEIFVPKGSSASDCTPSELKSRKIERRPERLARRTGRRAL